MVRMQAVLQAEVTVRLGHDFAELSPDLVATTVAECFAASDMSDGESVAAFRAEKFARARLETHRPRPLHG